MARRKWNYDIIQQVMDGTNPFIQVGYSKPYKSRKIGEEWTDGRGVTWKKTAYGKCRVNKQMDSIRDVVKQRCEICKKDMNLLGTKSDMKVFIKSGKCFDCLEIQEQTMKVTGQFDAYEFKKMMKNKLGALKEFRSNALESVDFLKKDDAKLDMVHSNGTVTTWVGAQNEPLLKEILADIEKADKEIADLEDAVSKLEVK